MLEGVVSGLVLAFISGLTFMAYKHPAGYRTLVTKVIAPVGIGLLLGGALVAFFGIFMNANTALVIAKEFPDTTLVSFSKEMAEVREYSTKGLWGIAILLASAAYLSFLWFLPMLTRGRNLNAA